MKALKAKEIRNMDDATVEEKLQEAKSHLSKMKFSHKVAGTENPMMLRKRRREIARIITVMKERTTSK